MTPIYTHDCKGCIYLGTITGPDPYQKESPTITFDLYLCENNHFGGDIIARYSSVGQDYRSYDRDTVSDHKCHPALIWADELLKNEERSENTRSN